jgi:hypothetical protein
MRFLGLILLIASTSATGKAGSAAAETPSAPATPLRVVGSKPFTKDDFLAWIGSPRCANGNIYLLLTPQWPNAAPGPRTEMRRPTPRAVLSISTDGKKTTTIDPSSVPTFSDATITTLAIAAGDDGVVYLLEWVERGDTGNYYILSFDKSGRYLTRAEVPPGIIPARFEVFDSSEFLLIGPGTHGEGPRVVIMPAKGGELRDVIGTPTVDAANDFEGERPPIAIRAIFDHVMRGGEGSVYFASALDNSIHVIGRSGDSHREFELAPVPRNRSLVGLLASGQRLVAKYSEPGTQTSRIYVDVYDLAVGERVDTYGPLQGTPLCYEHHDSGDRFILLGDGNRLVTASP